LKIFNLKLSLNLLSFFSRRRLAGGFCYLNNSAIVAQRLRAAGRRVAILDVDLHHGNGTQGIFYARGDVPEGSAAFRLLVTEIMHQADTLASQPPAFEHKLKVNAERTRRAQTGCQGMCG
jgi:acetoin utilization deacetylase AcuC-like enzyme